MEIVNDKVNRLLSTDLKTISSKERDNLKNAYYFREYYFYFFNYNNEIYHNKMFLSLNQKLVNELLGQIITSYFSNNIVKSKLFVNESGAYNLLTKNFIDVNKKYSSKPYEIFYKIKRDTENLSLFELNSFDILYSNDKKQLLNVDSNDLKKLKYDLKVMIISDYIRNQTDRVFRNIMFEYNDNHVKLCPLYDFEFSFLVEMRAWLNTFIIDFECSIISKFIKNDDDFQQILNIAMNIDFNEVLDRLYSEYGITFNDEEKESYNNVITSRQKDIKKYKLLR